MLKENIVKAHQIYQTIRNCIICIRLKKEDKELNFILKQDQGYHVWTPGILQVSSRMIISTLGTHDSRPMLLNINFHGVLTRAEPGIEDGMWIVYKLYTATEDRAVT